MSKKKAMAFLKDLLTQSYEDIEDRHKNGWKWCNHPSEEQFSLMVEV